MSKALFILSAVESRRPGAKRNKRVEAVMWFRVWVVVVAERGWRLGGWGWVTSGCLCSACRGAALLMSTKPSGLSVKATALCSNRLAAVPGPRQETEYQNSGLYTSPTLHNRDITRHKTRKATEWKKRKKKKKQLEKSQVWRLSLPSPQPLSLHAWLDRLHVGGWHAGSERQRPSEWRRGSYSIYRKAYLTLRTCRDRVKCHQGHLRRARAVSDITPRSFTQTCVTAGNSVSKKGPLTKRLPDSTCLRSWMKGCASQGWF